jgi:hypothetical protein
MVHWSRIGAAFLLPLAIAIASPIQEESAEEQRRVLFVYDVLDDDSRFFIEAIRSQLDNMNLDIEEVAVANSDVQSLKRYDYVLLYSRVMAFNMKSPVRGWVRKRKHFRDAKLFIFVTANRWFEQKHRQELLSLAKKRNARVIDAVTMATKDMTEAQKAQAVKEKLQPLQPRQ